MKMLEIALSIQRSLNTYTHKLLTQGLRLQAYDFLTEGELCLRALIFHIRHFLAVDMLRLRGLFLHIQYLLLHFIDALQ